ncbi:MFS family permease [Kitasatospora sp. MAA4]|uniref:MFS transporter n=1 Tax=Kitasatospora sp. MAA4 TaxID=3035093 RepID=UPI0024742222|nr:MFS transporter [Kitasatospora sp. MAA4]MDH6135738.1 MFS family permease [Kitasatospora sp. MAA4]
MGLIARGAPLPRTVWLLLAARTINRLGAFSLSFLAVLVHADFGASIATAGLVCAAFGVATIPSRLVGGRLADRLGRRRTIVLGLTGCAIAQLAIAQAQSLTQVSVFAVLLGLAFELYEPASQAIIADAVGPSERVRAYSLFNAALAAGGMGAGLVAAALGRWDLRWLFVADALSCLLCAGLIQLALPRDPRRTVLPQASSDQPTAISPWRDRALLLVLAGGTLFALIYLQIMTELPLTLTLGGLAPTDAGVLFTVSAATIIAAQPLLRLERLAALSAPAALGLGYTLLAAGVAGYAVAHTLTAAAATTIVWSLGDLLIMGRAYALVADLAPPGGTGRYLAVYGVSWGIAAVAAPILGTQLLQYWGPTLLWSATAAACLALAVGQPLVARAVVKQS